MLITLNRIDRLPSSVRIVIIEFVVFDGDNIASGQSCRVLARVTRSINGCLFLYISKEKFITTGRDISRHPKHIQNSRPQLELPTTSWRTITTLCLHLNFRGWTVERERACCLIDRHPVEEWEFGARSKALPNRFRGGFKIDVFYIYYSYDGVVGHHNFSNFCRL